MGKISKQQKKALELRREAFKNACKDERAEKPPFNKTPKVSPPIDSQTTNKPESI
jgi:hypothetical protein